MKKLLIACLCSTAFALTSFGQEPTATAASPVSSPDAANPALTNPAASPGATVDPNAPIAPAGAMPGTSPVEPGMTPAVPGATPAFGASPAMSVAATVAPTEAPSATPTPKPAGGLFTRENNFFVEKFQAGGPIMWPIVITMILGLTVVIERICWWLGRWMKRDPKRTEKVFTAIENGDVAEASRLSRGTRDPVLRMLWNGLNHHHASLQGALQVAAGIEIKRAGRFLVVMDTLVTLAPLLGLLGTITGLMKSFGSLGNDELAVQAVTGGIAEALIATACGLGIAIFCLIPFNFFTSRVSNLEFELQTAATNLEVMLDANSKAKHDIEVASASNS